MGKHVHSLTRMPHSEIQISCQYRNHSQQQLIYRYHIFQVSSQARPVTL